MAWTGGPAARGVAAANEEEKRRRKEEKRKWECVEVGHHRTVGKTIEEWQRDGWRLHTYQATGYAMDVKHYLLFEKVE